MTPTIERVTKPYAAPAGSLYLRPEGWTPDPYEIIIDTQGSPLDQAMDLIWYQYGGLLGDGQLSFKVTSEQPPRGYLVFTPAEETS